MSKPMTADLGRRYIEQSLDELAVAVCENRKADAQAYRDRIEHLKVMIARCEVREAKEKERRASRCA